MFSKTHSFSSIRFTKTYAWVIPHATREQVIAAAQAAQCDEFIQHLPKQYDTIIGEEGVYLSGGEEQRISVARAILKNSPILVLDEATAFADPENEYKMQLAIQKLIRDKTVIIIAHLAIIYPIGQPYCSAERRMRCATGHTRGAVPARGRLQKNVGCLYRCISMDIK